MASNNDIEENNVEPSDSEHIESKHVQVGVDITLVGQLKALKNLFTKPKDVSFDVHEEALSLRRELFKDSQIYNMFEVRDGSSDCSLALISLFVAFFDQERQTFKIKDGIEISFCAHRVAKLLSIHDTGNTISKSEIEGKHETLIRFPDFVQDLKELYMEKNERKEKKDKDDKECYRDKKVKRDLSRRTLVNILTCMPLQTAEEKDRYMQLMRLFVIDQIFFPSSEFLYIRSGNWKYSEKSSTFESINWAQAILDRIYFAIKKKTKYLSASSAVFQALIFDKIPKLVPKDTKLKTTVVPADKYSGIKRTKEYWTSKLAELKPEDINKCDLCYPLDLQVDHGLQMPIFQSACDGFMLAVVIEKAKEMLEGSLEGEYLSEIGYSELVEGLKDRYMTMDYKNDWALISALSSNDPPTLSIVPSVIDLEYSNNLTRMTVNRMTVNREDIFDKITTLDDSINPTPKTVDPETEASGAETKAENSQKSKTVDPETEASGAEPIAENSQKSSQVARRIQPDRAKKRVNLVDDNVDEVKKQRGRGRGRGKK